MADDLQQHRADQAGITNATAGMLYGLAGTIFAGAFWLALRPSSIDLKGPAAAAFSIAMLSVMTTIGGWAFLMVRLGGADAASEHRAWYVDFRARIRRNDGSINYMLGDYGAMVRNVLHAADRFLGDAGGWRRSLFPRAFGLRKAAPLWTAASYDRCLLLALCYPLLVVILTWVATDHIGPLERALLMRHTPGWLRAASVVFAVLSGLTGARLLRFEGSRLRESGATVLGLGIYIAAGLILFQLGAGGGIAAMTYIVGNAMWGRTGAYVVAIALVLGTAGENLWAGGVALVVSFVIGIIEDERLARQRQGGLLLLYTLAMLALVLVLPAWLPSLTAKKSYLLLYFCGLLTLVNAPFDWLALGVTRLLLRQGLQRKGFAPLWFGLLDLLLSLVIMALLMIAMLWATELFNATTRLGGRPPVLEIEPLLRAVTDPALRGDPSLWWLYATLFSTQIPSLINVVLGAFCILRGMPRVNRWIEHRLPPEGAIGIWQRFGIAGAWGAQLGFAVFLGVGLLYVFYVQGALLLLDSSFGMALVQILRAVSIAPLLP